MQSRSIWAVLFALGLIPSAWAQNQPDAPAWREGRKRLVAQLAEAGIQDSLTLAAMRAVPRHLFVPPNYRSLAYEDIPIPIGHDQTISQPAVVALMTQLIAPRQGQRVLEVGTGSGYQAAVLSQAGCRVWTIEIYGALAKEASDRLARLGYTDVQVRHGDGYAGWPEQAPFEAILVTAAADSIPPALLDQLAAGGRLVMPVGSQYSEQELVLVQKDDRGRLASRQLFPVRFVPLLRGVR